MTQGRMDYDLDYTAYHLDSCIRLSHRSLYPQEQAIGRGVEPRR